MFGRIVSRLNMHVEKGRLKLRARPGVSRAEPPATSQAGGIVKPTFVPTILPPSHDRIRNSSHGSSRPVGIRAMQKPSPNHTRWKGICNHCIYTRYVKGMLAFCRGRNGWGSINHHGRSLQFNEITIKSLSSLPRSVLGLAMTKKRAPLPLSHTNRAVEDLK